MFPVALDADLAPHLLHQLLGQGESDLLAPPLPFSECLRTGRELKEPGPAGGRNPLARTHHREMDLGLGPALPVQGGLNQDLSSGRVLEGELGEMHEDLPESPRIAGEE